MPFYEGNGIPIPMILCQDRHIAQTIREPLAPGALALPARDARVSCCGIASKREPRGASTNWGLHLT